MKDAGARLEKGGNPSAHRKLRPHAGLPRIICFTMSVAGEPERGHEDSGPTQAFHFCSGQGSAAERLQCFYDGPHAQILRASDKTFLLGSGWRSAHATTRFYGGGSVRGTTCGCDSGGGCVPPERGHDDSGTAHASKQQPVGGQFAGILELSSLQRRCMDFNVDFSEVEARAAKQTKASTTGCAKRRCTANASTGHRTPARRLYGQGMDLTSHERTACEQ